LAAAIAVLATAGPLGWSRGFGTFLFTILFYLPAVILFSICFCIWAWSERKSPRWRPIGLATAVAFLLVPITLFGLPMVKDEIGFRFWYETHRSLVEPFLANNAIILDWESWGLAGMENDSYLVSDPSDRLDKTSEKALWLHDVGSDCDLVATDRMARGLYIVTTYNCVLR
jgi:hypothetical protein